MYSVLPRIKSSKVDLPLAPALGRVSAVLIASNGLSALVDFGRVLPFAALHLQTPRRSLYTVVSSVDSISARHFVVGLGFADHCAFQLDILSSGRR